VQGRSLRILRADDHESVTDGRLVAQRFSNNLDMVAVIGHLNSHVSIPAATIYEGAGLLMMTPGSTNPRLTESGYRYVFQSVNSDREVGLQMAQHARSSSYRRIIICYVGNEYGLGLANAFEQEATRADVEVVDRQSYDPAITASPKSFESMLDNWEDLEYDAIFLAGMPPHAGHFIRQARSMGVTVPVFGGDALDTDAFIEAAGPDADGVVAASIFHPDNPRAEVQGFRAAFEKVYRETPDSWAARGYEVTTLLAAGMKEAGSVVPSDVAAALRSHPSWKSITGSFSFDGNGAVVGKPFVTAMVQNGRFTFLEENHGANKRQAAVAAPASVRSAALNR